jgi:hypothetical protein
MGHSTASLACLKDVFTISDVEGAQEGGPMLTIMLSSLLIGSVLGLRFRMQVLLAAIGTAVVIVGTEGLLRHSSSFALLGALTATVIAMQVGYLLGVLGRLARASIPPFMPADARSVGLRKSAFLDF